MIEMIVVLSVVSVLLSVGIFALNSHQERLSQAEGFQNYQTAKRLAVLVGRLHQQGFRSAQSLTVEQLSTLPEANQPPLRALTESIVKATAGSDITYTLLCNQQHAEVSFAVAKDVVLPLSASERTEGAGGTDRIYVTSSAIRKQPSRNLNINRLLNQRFNSD